MASNEAISNKKITTVFFLLQTNLSHSTISHLFSFPPSWLSLLWNHSDNYCGQLHSFTFFFFFLHLVQCQELWDCSGINQSYLYSRWYKTNWKLSNKVDFFEAHGIDHNWLVKYTVLSSSQSKWNIFVCKIYFTLEQLILDAKIQVFTRWEQKK